jgi:hypothetical protein
MTMNTTVYKVYWSQVEGDQEVSKTADFAKEGMSDALKFMESLRKVQRDSGTVRFVTFCSENPDSVGRPGVDTVGPNYDWKKRRI